MNFLKEVSNTIVYIVDDISTAVDELEMVAGEVKAVCELHVMLCGMPAADRLGVVLGTVPAV